MNCSIFPRSAYIGSLISLDYWWSSWGVDDTTEEYLALLEKCHARAAERILYGCLKVSNGNGFLV